MPTGTFLGGWSTPGMGSLDITSERNILTGFGSVNNITILMNAVLAGAARDSGNTPTNVCRSGLTLGQIAASGQYTAYAPGNTDGSQIAVGFLYVEALTQDFSGSNADRSVPIVVGGMVKSSQLIGLDGNARATLRRQFLFDDDLAGRENYLGNKGFTAKTTSYTCVAGDNGKTFTTTGAAGAVTFTLPAIASNPGWSATFINTVNQNMQVTSAEGTNMVMPGFTAAAGGTNAAFQTAGQKSGGIIRVANLDGVLWFLSTLSINALTTS